MSIIFIIIVIIVIIIIITIIISIIVISIVIIFISYSVTPQSCCFVVFITFCIKLYSKIGLISMMAL